jgi:hypothetical protein
MNIVPRVERKAASMCVTQFVIRQVRPSMRSALPNERCSCKHFSIAQYARIAADDSQ